MSEALVNAFVEDGSLPGLEAAIDEYGKLSEQEPSVEELTAASTLKGPRSRQRHSRPARTLAPLAKVEVNIYWTVLDAWWPTLRYRPG
ncbi:MAG: hypothetical protein EOR08_08505 [Mesorhizobium sp.]|nr:MAG: hypothetical protein EOR08_08505 [Mesorhizobium sp.]